MATEVLVFPDPVRPSPSLAVGGRIVELPRQRIELGGVLIDRVDLPTAVNRIREFSRSGSTHQVLTVNLDFISIAQRDPRFRDTINSAALAVADGMPLLWLSRLAGQPLPERITGVELVDESCQIAAEEGQRVFLLGAAPGVADAAAQVLEARYPGLRVAGVYAPPFGPLSPADDARMVELVRQAAADFLFVAFGAPRQDLWIRTHFHQLDVAVAMGVGCVFDLLAGAVRRAPVWMQRTGLEWSYRLVQEPRRLWRRYLVDDLPMLGKLALGCVRGSRPPVPAAPAPAVDQPG